MSTEWRSARIAMLMAKLERHRDNTARLEERRAKYGLNVPLELENELADERAMAMEVEAQLQHLMTGGEDPLDRLFREATRARLKGQVGRALQLYEQIQRGDPTYPDIAVHVMRTKEELARGYIDNGGRVVPERVRQYPTMRPVGKAGGPPAVPAVPAGWLRVAGAIAALLCAVSGAVFYSVGMPGPKAAPTATSVVAVQLTATHTRRPATATPRPATATHTPTLTATPRPATATHTPTLTATPTHIVPTPTRAADFKILKQDIRPLGSTKCETPEIHMYVLDKDGNLLDNILLEVYWEGGSKTFNSGWLGPGYEKATVSAGTFWVRVVGDVRPFGDRDYTSEVSRSLSTDQPTREDLEKAGYCQPGGECVECGLYSYEVVFQRQW